MEPKYYIILFMQTYLVSAFILPHSSYMATPYCVDKIRLIKENCGCDQLILPPKAIELPPGLGYGPSALPAVAEAYDQKLFVRGLYSDFSDAYVPISSPCCCVKLATPVPSDIVSLVHPVIL